MWHALLLLLGDLVGDDGQTPVHLHGVCVDDLAIEFECQIYRELRTKSGILSLV